MKSLFSRLKEIGYDQAFVRAAILPDWWEDSLANEATSRMQMQIRVARRLGLSLADVADGERALSLPDTKSVRLKRATTGTERDQIAPAIVVARRTVQLAVSELKGLPAFPANLEAADVRSFILRTYPVVDFAGLVKAAWAHGIAVFHFNQWPKGARKFAGMAYYEGKIPVIVIASGHDAPPKLAYYLAHEIGHILRAHVVPNGEVLVDGDLESAQEDIQEREADEDALIMLSGSQELDIPPAANKTAVKLRAWAKRVEQAQSIHAGTAALMFGRERKRMSVAIAALKLMNMDTGAHSIIAEEMRRHLVPDDGSVDLRDLPSPLIEVLPLLGLNNL